MRCRHFTLRLTAQHAQDDESRLNEFMQGVQVHSVQTSAGAPGLWSVLIFYDELPGIAAGRSRRAVASTLAASSTPTEASPVADAPLVADDLTPEQQRVYERLREWRAQRASAEGKPAYVIAHNAVLKEIARRHMALHVADDLLSISQLGPARTARYGPDIIALLATLGQPDEALLFDDER